MQTTKERTGWRDERISLRHRMWGVDCKATDIDFLLIEYESKSPAALIEYKNEFAPPQKPSNTQYKVLVNLGNSANIPVIAVRYANDFSKFKVIPLNKRALYFVPDRIEMSESEYVNLLYKMRGIETPQNVLEALR